MLMTVDPPPGDCPINTVVRKLAEFSTGLMGETTMEWLAHRLFVLC